MKRWNLLLAILIAGVLIFPGAVVAKVIEACCGVVPIDLVVTAPEEACVSEDATINGTYTTDPLYDPWAPYDTGVDLTVLDPDGGTVVDETLIISENETEVGEFTFDYTFHIDMEGTYSYQVVAWTTGPMGKNSSGVVGGTIEAEVCNEPPDCSDAVPSISTIWPPNHKFVAITITGVTDPDGDPVTITIDYIRQDEPVDTYGDGKFSPDGKGVGTDTAEVRAERSGTKKVPGNGRVYHIGFTASDGELECSGEVLVGVPHDVKDTPVDDGGHVDSTTSP